MYGMIKIVNVVVDVPLNKMFSYTTDMEIAIGSRVLVEFHRKPRVAFVIEYTENSEVDIAKLKPILQVFDEVLPHDTLDLIKFAAKYYVSPLGQTLFTAIPTNFKKPLDLKLTKRKSAIKEEVILPPQKISLTVEQQQIIGAIKNKFNEYHSAILYGITGSGKTEVYLELIAEVIRQKRQALVLVPEINLTPQLLARFKRRFKDAVIHTLTSSSTVLTRVKGYLDASGGAADIIIGTRLSVFTPFKNLGIIIVDEEHDNSFKQNEGLRYHARDLAVYRAKYNNIPIVLGSATPSLETLYNYKLGRYSVYKLTARAVDSSNLPTIKIIDLNTNNESAGLSVPVINAINERLSKKEVSLVFINRRGYAPTVSCYDCGFVIACKNCSTNMVLHKDKYANHLKCHHCGFIQTKINICPKCNSQHLYPLGNGSQKIEEILANNFTTARVCRIDQDTMSSKKDWVELYNKIHNNEIDILVGTQMLAKGHDFHNITLVVGLNVDSSLFSYDFRATEVLFTQLTQVSGRAGRGDKSGEVLLQTKYPEHSVFQFLLKHDFIGFANHTLLERKIINLPPYSYYVMLRASGADINKTLDYINNIIKLANKSINIQDVLQYPVVPAILQKLKNRERVQALIQSNDRDKLHLYLRKLIEILEVNKPRFGITWNLDIDPIEV